METLSWFMFTIGVTALVISGGGAIGCIINWYQPNHPILTLKSAIIPLIAHILSWGLLAGSFYVDPVTEYEKELRNCERRDWDNDEIQTCYGRIDQKQALIEARKGK